MSVPEFVPLPYETVNEVVEAFESGAQFLLQDENGNTAPIYGMGDRGDVLHAWIDTSILSWHGDPTIACGADGESLYSARRIILFRARSAAEPAKAEPELGFRTKGVTLVSNEAIASACRAFDGVTLGDRAGIKPAVDLSYFNPPPIEQKRQGAGLLVVWQPRRHL